MDISTQYRLEVRGGSEIVARARAWAGEIALRLGADWQAAADFTLAVSEACTNVVRYAYAGQDESQLIITARRIGERVVFRVRDYGQKFDPSAVRPPDLQGDPTIGGYGIYLMRRVMDNIWYGTGHPDGTELMLVRRRRR